MSDQMAAPRLLPTAAVKDVAILARVTIVKMPRTFLAAFAGLFRHETFVAMEKPLELERGRRFSGKQADADTGENEDRSLHEFYPFCCTDA
jgi:hypothetical protein